MRKHFGLLHEKKLVYSRFTDLKTGCVNMHVVETLDYKAGFIACATSMTLLLLMGATAAVHMLLMKFKGSQANHRAFHNEVEPAKAEVESAKVEVEPAKATTASLTPVVETERESINKLTPNLKTNKLNYIRLPDIRGNSRV